MALESEVGTPSTLAGDFRLAGWLVQPSLNRVCSGDARRQIEPKLMDVLVFLAKHPGSVRSKDEIIEAVWARKFISETTLTRAVAELRRVLGDDAQDPRFIETIPKRGYRLVAPAEWLDDTAARTPGRALGAAPIFSIAWGDLDIPLEEGDNLIGRARDAVIRIASPRVSRRHARITVCGMDATLEDLGSRNGTYLRGQKLEGRAPLRDGDQICVGPAVLSFRLRHTGQTTQPEEAV
jgi:DNA-binding winged helix-turn-helix (wHTH) protein